MKESKRAGWCAIAIAVFTLQICASASAQKPEPYFVDYKIAGADLLNYFDFRPGYDKKQGYYLTYGGDCDGAHLRMLLSPAKKAVQSGQFYMCEERELGHLITGKGVMIGDNMAQVRMLLGKPTKKGRIDEWNLDVMRYIDEPEPIEPIVDNYEGIGFRYEAAYYFVKGKLFAIKISKDLIGGP